MHLHDRTRIQMETLPTILYVLYCIVVIQLPLPDSSDIFTKHPNDYYIKVFCSCKSYVCFSRAYVLQKHSKLTSNQWHISNSVKDKEKT